MKTILTAALIVLFSSVGAMAGGDWNDGYKQVHKKNDKHWRGYGDRAPYYGYHGPRYYGYRGPYYDYRGWRYRPYGYGYRPYGGYGYGPGFGFRFGW